MKIKIKKLSSPNQKERLKIIKNAETNQYNKIRKKVIDSILCDIVILACQSPMNEWDTFDKILKFIKESK